jgi:hypothetical protein
MDILEGEFFPVGLVYCSVMWIGQRKARMHRHVERKAQFIA